MNSLLHIANETKRQCIRSGFHTKLELTFYSVPVEILEHKVVTNRARTLDVV
jgi:hypothetical protein